MSKSFFRVSTRLLVTTALILGSYFSLAKSVLAQSTPPNTTITNTAVGTFEGTTSGTTGNVTSNTVTLSVLEVAGINAAPSGNQEAPFAVPNAGAFQGVAGINTGDVVYFDFTVTNVGNDPTGFFIPGTATIGGGTLENIQIIEVDPNGALGAPTPTTVAVTVPVGGDNTIALLGATNGYIPVNGTVTVRVAVKVTETNVGNSITATLGNTTGSAGTQNQPYLANANQDLYTNDLIDGTTIPVPYAGILAISQVPETNGNPANGDATNRRQEASATGSVTLAATPVVFGYKSVTRTNDVDGSGTNTPGDVLTWRVTYANTGTVDVTDFQIADVLPANVTLSGTLAAGNITVNATQSGTTPIANAGYTGTGNNNLFNSSFTLVAGGVVTVDIPVTINVATPSGTVLSNQPTATSTVLPAVGVRTDNIDGTNVGLPLGIPAPTGSIPQTQTGAIDPTTATVVSPANVSGYKSVKLTTDTAPLTTLNSGDTVTWTVIYQNTGASPVPNFQISDVLPTGVAISGTPTVTVTGGGQTAPTVNAGYTGAGNNNLFSATVPLVPNGVIAVKIPVTIAPLQSGDKFNQATATGTGIPSTNTDNVDDLTPSLPADVIAQIETGSIDQTEAAGVDPTRITIIATEPKLLLVKRMTAVNGVNINGFIDDPGTTDDNDTNWPTDDNTYLRGAINGVSVKPGDQLEYTIYFLSAGNTNVSNVVICDLVPPLTTFVNNAYDVVGGGSGLGMAFGSSTTVLPITPTSYLTYLADSDKGRFYPAGSTPNTTAPLVTVCNKPNTAIPMAISDNTDGLVVVDVIKTSDPLPNFLPFATGAGTPTNSYGFVRFQVQVK
jgi:uncharacterized repeat protein (TIGR01451 family)